MRVLLRALKVREISCQVVAYRLSMRSCLVPSFLFFALYLPSALSFSISVGSSPTQCGPLNVTWTAGKPPFQIMLIPVYDIPRNISVPSTAFNHSQGAYQISSIPFLKGTQFLLTMSDATGFATGGISDLLTVGAPIGSASCNTSNFPLSFSFSLPSSLQQCNPYIFDDYNEATLPVTIAGFIPGGESFLLHPPSTGSSFTWIADVAAGTTIVFTLTDAEGNSGGSSDTETVALSNDASCLNANSPSSTLSPIPSSTSPAGSSTPSPAQTRSGISTGIIVGVAVGVLLAISGIAALAVFCLKRQRYRRTPYGLAPARKSRRPNSVELDPSIDNYQHPPIYPFPYQIDSTSHLGFPIGSGSPLASFRGMVSSRDPSVHVSETPYTHQHAGDSNTDSFAVFGDVSSSSASTGGGRRKAAVAGMTGYQPVTRFIVHTDAEDRFPEDAAEVVELPPQYSERQTPTIRPTGERSVSPAARLSSANGQHVDEPPHPISHPPE